MFPNIIFMTCYTIDIPIKKALEIIGLFDKSSKDLTMQNLYHSNTFPAKFDLMDVIFQKFEYFSDITGRSNRMNRMERVLQITSS